MHSSFRGTRLVALGQEFSEPEVRVGDLENRQTPTTPSTAMSRFSPGALTAWHSHGLGQSLYIVDRELGGLVAADEDEQVDLPDSLDAGVADRPVVVFPVPLRADRSPAYAPGGCRDPAMDESHDVMAEWRETVRRSAM
ncbi:hypothetical protein ACWC09_18465 [Streptomyces sp. NPDC001617]